MKSGLAAWLFLLAALVLSAPSARADAEFDARSLALRTALHHDASLEAPFQDLLRLYETAGRTEELLALYEAHLAQYPTDRGARTVQLRLLLAQDAPQVTEQAAQAVQLHPEDAYLHFLAYRANGDLGPLIQAIALETRSERRALWLEEAIGAAVSNEERNTVAAALLAERDRRLANNMDGWPQLVAWMRDGGFAELARETLGIAASQALAPETELELALLAARLLPREEAEPRLADLLERLAPEHPGRPELVRARREISPDPAALIREAERLQGQSAASAVDLATLFEAEGQGAKSASVLTEAALRLPHLGWLEERARVASASDPAQWREFLDRRVLLSPDRPELRAERIRLSFQMDGAAAGQATLKEEAERDAGPEHATFLAEVGDALLAGGHFEGAEIAFRAAQQLGADGFRISGGLVRALAAKGGGSSALSEAIRALDLAGASGEDLSRLAAFLDGEGWVAEARELLERAVTTQPGDFGTMLALAKVSAPQRQEALLEQSRALATEEEAYRDWLIAAAEFYAARGDAEALWSREEARLGASAGIDPDIVRRVATFAAVAGERSQEARAKRVVSKLWDRAGEEREARPDLQRLAVSAFAEDPARAPEVERMLRALVDANAVESTEDRLRLALLYDRVGRPDLATPELASLDWEKIDTPALLDQAVTAWPDERPRVWQRLIQVRPADGATWEALLNGLSDDRRDREFREVARRLTGLESPLALADPVRSDLEERIFATWQRELEQDVRLGDTDAALRKVRSLIAEVQPQAQSDWLRWFGGALLERTGREKEADAWYAQIQDRAHFHALQSLSGDPVEEEPPPVRIAPLHQVSWRFHPRDGTAVASLASLGDAVFVLDERNRLYALDATTGKVRWQRESGGRTPSAASARLPGDLFVAPDLLARGDQVFVGLGDRIVAVSAASGETIWEALAGGPGRTVRIGLAGGDLVIGLFAQAGVLAGFDRSTGKLRWRVDLDSGVAELPSASLGFAASGAVVAVFAGSLDLYRAQTGERLWSRAVSPPAPLRLQGSPGPAPSTPVDPPPRHVAFHGDRVLAMEAGTVYDFRTTFPGACAVSPLTGIALGGDGRSACFQAGADVEILELGTGERKRLPGSGRAVLASGAMVLRAAPGRLTAWHPRTGRRLWETAFSEEAERTEPSGAWWRGAIFAETWQGVVIRRTRPSLAVAMPGGVAVVGETGVEGWTP